MPYTENSHALGRSPSRPEDPTTTKRKPAKSRETRLERARPHVMLLAACLVCLTTALLAFQISITSVSNLKWIEYKRVDDELRAHSSALRKEKIVYSRLDDLLSTQLRRNLMETYEECLVRGLKEAHHELVGLGFQYPHVREQIIDWTTKECGRLQYSLQVVNEKTSPQEAAVAYWADVSYRARRIAEETLGLVRQKLDWVLSRFVGSSQHEEASLRTNSAIADEVTHTEEPVLPERLLPPVPFGFALQCEAGHSCRLVYPDDSTMYDFQPRVLPELLEKLRERRKELLAFGSTLDWFGAAVKTASRTVHYFQIFFHLLYVLMYGPYVANSIIYKTRPSPAGLQEGMIYLAKSLVLELFSFALLSLLDTKPRLFPSMNYAFPFALLFASIGLNMVLKLFFPGSHLESVINMYTSLRDLYLIIRDCDIAEEEYASEAINHGEKQQEAQNGSPDTKIASQSEGTAPDQSGVCPPSKPYYRLANPETTVQQDIEHTRQILRQTRAQQAAGNRADMNAGFETDTESDSDDVDAFVHIAGDITREPDAVDDVPAWLMI